MSDKIYKVYTSSEKAYFEEVDKLRRSRGGYFAQLEQEKVKNVRGVDKLGLRAGGDLFKSRDRS